MTGFAGEALPVCRFILNAIRHYVTQLLVLISMLQIFLRTYPPSCRNAKRKDPTSNTSRYM